MIFNQTYECMEREELRQLQLERLRQAVARVHAGLPFYQDRFRTHGVTPEDLQTLEDLQQFPFVTKQDLREGYPFGFFAVPPTEVLEVHASSGTTGKPVVDGYTRKDLDLWSELMARALCCAGATDRDIIHNAYGYGLFTGGLGVHYGARRLGARVIPMSGGQTKRQVMIMRDFGSTVLTCTPSYALHIGEVAEEEGIDPRTLPLRLGIFGAEAWSENMRGEIERKLALDAVDIYGLTEMIGPGVAQECLQKGGLHIFEDHFLPEIIDPVTGEVLDEGDEGELVITTLTREGLCLIRYRTGDITSLSSEPCGCGRTMVRMGKIKGRTDDMMIIRGVNIFPSQIENVLMRVEETEPHYQLVLTRRKGLDELTVEVEARPEIFADEVKQLEALERRIARDIAGELSLRVNVRLVEPRRIERSAGKAKRVIDKRELK